MDLRHAAHPQVRRVLADDASADAVAGGPQLIAGSRRLWFSLLLAVSACGDLKVPPNRWIEYVPGDAPVIIIAPHGGLLKPRGLKDRNCDGCYQGIDENTQELARLVADSFAVRTGRRPHLVLNLLYRDKFDANRDRLEATRGNPALDSTWYRLHAVVDSAKAAATRVAGRALVIDLHGHDHDSARVEVGYLVDAAALRRSDDDLATALPLMATSIREITRHTASGDGVVAMHNGPNSMGGMLAAAGLPAVPSPADRAPAPNEEYFNGGYNTYVHGSTRGGVVDAIQLELPRETMRDTPRNVRRVAGILARVLAQYLERHYGWR